MSCDTLVGDDLGWRQGQLLEAWGGVRNLHYPFHTCGGELDAGLDELEPIVKLVNG